MWLVGKIVVGITIICLVCLFGVTLFLIVGMAWMSLKEAYVESGWLGAVFLGMLYWLGALLIIAGIFGRK